MTDTQTHAAIAPLVRGLYLAEAGRPVFVVPGEALAADSPSPADLSISSNLAIPAIALSNLNEVDAAAQLKSAFSDMGASESHLPGCLVVESGGVRKSFYAGISMASARARAAARDASFWDSGVGMAGAGGNAASAARRASVVAGKIAVVTGGAQGFGEEIVRGLASSGAYVFVADMNLDGAVRLAAALNAERGCETAAAISVNVADEASVESMFATIVLTAGGLDLVVSNAGVLKAASVLDQDLAAFRFVTDVNYSAFMLVTKHAGRIMRAQSRTAGRRPADIIQINSKSGLQGSNRNGSYAGSKFGSLGLVQSFALELVEFGIKVNAICPGNFFDGSLWSDPVRGLFVQYLDTGKVPGAKTIADVKAFYEAKVPMGRGCTGPDVMRAIYYLVEQEYETGQALPVTGGQVMLN